MGINLLGRSANRTTLIPLLHRRAFGVLGVGAAAPILGLLFGLPEEGVIGGILFVVGFVVLAGLRDYVVVRQFLKQVTVSLKVPNRLFSATDSELEISIFSSFRRRACLLELRPISPSGIEADAEVKRALLPGVRDSTVGRRTRLTYRFQPLSRGEMCWERVVVRISPVGGMTWWQSELRIEPARAIVYPKESRATDEKQHRFQRLAAGEGMMNLSGGEGREFDSLRRYSFGDDLRKADWKRSARAGSILVKVYRPETHQRVMIAIDCSRRMANRVDRRLQLDYAADAASYLIRAAARHDDEVGLFAFDHTIVTRVASKRGRAQEELLLRKLALLPVGTMEADYQLLTEWARFAHRRSLLVLLTSISNPATFEVIRQALNPVRQKHLALVMAMADQDLERLVDQPAKTLDEAYIVSAGVEQSRVLRSRVELLHRSGIECIYTSPHELPEKLAEKYRKLKLSGRL